jgi:carbamoyl-phosphate synthase large subunit
MEPVFMAFGSEAWRAAKPIASPIRNSAQFAIRRVQELGFRIKATDGTQQFLEVNGVKAELSYKLHEHQRPNIVDEIKSKEIHLIINTPIGKIGQFDDAYIRQAAIKYKIPYITTTAAARASVVGIAEYHAGRARVKSLQRYHRDIG